MKTFYNIYVMEVYIEYVVLDNLIMDYLLLKQTAVLLKEKFSKLNVFFGALAGTFGAVILPLFSIKKEYLFLLKVCLGAFMCFIAVKHLNFKGYLKYFNVFLLMTFVCGGAVIGVFYLLGISLTDYGGTKSYLLPVGVSVLCGYLLVKITKFAVKKTIDSIITDRYRYKCLIKCGQVALKVDGYFDSGNLLYDTKTGLPVALCKKSVIEKLKKRGAVFLRTSEMDFSTVLNGGKLKLYEIDCILIELGNTNKRTCCMLGEVSDDSFKEQLLLGAYML